MKLMNKYIGALAHLQVFAWFTTGRQHLLNTSEVEDSEYLDFTNDDKGLFI
ncbi:MAG: hypothetical protein ABGX00_17405 [Allomuricauda sp.]